jgi:hypothetical protein
VRQTHALLHRLPVPPRPLPEGSSKNAVRRWTINVHCSGRLTWDKVSRPGTVLSLEHGTVAAEVLRATEWTDPLPINADPHQVRGTLWVRERVSP